MEAHLKPKAPTPPDPTKTAQAQTDQSIGTNLANNTIGMVSQRGPDGSLTYNQTGSQQINIGGKTYDIPQYEAVTSLSDVAQKRYDTTNDATQNMAEIAKLLSGRIEDQAGNPVSMDNLPDLPGSGGYEASRKSVEDALYSRLNPQLQQARSARETDLANRGIRIGSAAYDRAMAGVGQNENDARQQVVLAGGQEQSRLAGMDSAARAQLLQERYQSANDPVNRLTALLSGSQVNTPNYQTYTPQGMQTTDVAGLIQQGFGNQMANYKIKNDNYQQAVGGLFDLASAGVTKYSDANLKKDIEPAGIANGHNIYAYRYKGESPNAPKQLGVMAQEVERTNPDAVVETPIGKAVNYGKLGLFGLGRMGA